MEIDSKLVLLKAEQLYHIKRLRRINIGGSGNSIFEVESERGPYILRVSNCDEGRKAHIEFELNWVEYLAARMEGIVRPVRSLNNRLYEVFEEGDQAYVLCLMEKAKGKTVNINDSEEFNQVLFFNLGALMGRMHKLTTSYEGNRACPEFKWNGPYFLWYRRGQDR